MKYFTTFCAVRIAMLILAIVTTGCATSYENRVAETRNGGAERTSQPQPEAPKMTCDTQIRQVSDHIKNQGDAGATVGGILGGAGVYNSRGKGDSYRGAKAGVGAIVGSVIGRGAHQLLRPTISYERVTKIVNCSSGESNQAVHRPAKIGQHKRWTECGSEWHRERGYCR